MTTRTIVFDLDDTLIKEFDYLKSAFYEIAQQIDVINTESIYKKMLLWYKQKENVFQNILKEYSNLDLSQLKSIYRNHFPKFENTESVRELLQYLSNKKYKIGIITDGYSITQRNKIKALDIEPILDLIIISEEFGQEKPSFSNYEVFHQFNTDEYYYIGDNFNKDFIAPNQLKWNTIALLDNGFNIHTQNFNLDKKYLPQVTINKLSDLKKILDE